MLSDLRFALRQLAKAPGFSVTALLTLAIGIGACTAIFSVVNSVLLRPIPYPDSDRLVWLNESHPPQYPIFSVAPGNYFSWRERARSFEQLAALRPDSYAMTGRGEATQVRAGRVTANFLATLRLQPIRGRDFRAEEDAPGSDAVVLLSHGFWQTQFGGRDTAVGDTLHLDGRPFTIIGVLPESFRDHEILTPAAFSAEERRQHQGHYIQVVGRLRNGVSLEAARTEMALIGGQLADEHPSSNTGWTVLLQPLQEHIVGNVRPTLLALLGAVGFLLLIGCANVANLLLVRASARTREIALRATQGASPGRILRQLLTESVVLAALGGLLGTLIAVWSVSALVAWAPANLPRATEITVDASALWFTSAIVLATGLLFGIAPALQASRLNLNVALKDASRGGGARSRVRNGLVVAEVALALMLLVGCGLLMRSFARLNAVDPGFVAEDAWVAGLNLPRAHYGDGEVRKRFVAEVTDKLAAIPGVTHAGAVSTLILTGDDYTENWYREDQPRPAPGEAPSAKYFGVSPDYFRALGTPLLAGRFFDARDHGGAPRVVIINETMAKRFFPRGDALGKRINITSGPEMWREIVGIVGDVKQTSLSDEPVAQMYDPFAQTPFPFLNFVIRTAPGAPAVAPAIRAAIHAVDANLPVFRLITMEQLVARTLARQTFSASMFGAFAAAALLLAAVGIYGVMAYSVNQRTSEIGIRMALGAQRADVLRLILGQGGRLVALGILIGLVGAFGVTRFLGAMLYQVGIHDPTTFAGIAGLLAVVATLASYLPARRATKVDPLTALRAA